MQHETRNDAILDGLNKATAAVQELKNTGFDVIAIDVFGMRPTIQVKNSFRTAAKIEAGDACYYRYQVQDGEHQRFGQFQLENCRVIWVEREH